MMVQRKRFLKKALVAVVSAVTLMSLLAGLIIQLPPQALLLMVLIVLAAGTIGAMLGWFIVGIIYSQLQITSRKPIVAKDESRSSVLPGKMSVEVEYELNVEDEVAFRLYNYTYSRKLLRYMYLTACLSEILVATVLVVASGRPHFAFVFALSVLAALTLVYYLVSTSIFRKRLRWTVIRDNGERPSKLLGRQRLSVNAESVSEITPAGKSITRWNTVERVASTDQYIFIKVRGSVPYIVPRRAFASEEEFNQFIGTVKAYHQAAMTD